MKVPGQFRPFLTAFGLAVVGYALLYSGIQWRRSRLGPWQVLFTAAENGQPMLRISQPRLAITNQEVIFSVPPQPGSPAPLTFADPKPVPFDLPFGKCIFMDTTFLPGSVTFGLFGHTVELLPRTLIIDNQEQPWRSNLRIEVPEIAKPKH